MRTFFVGFFLVIFFIFSIPLFLIEHIIGLFSHRIKTITSYKFVRFAIKTVLFISGTKCTLIGVENIPKDKAYLYVANHRGFFDIVLALATNPTNSGFLAKAEMNKVPFLRVWMRNINCLFLNRDDMREGLKVILKGIELVNKGFSMFICPEGTRSQSDEMLPFKEGSLKIAEKSGCPIVPVAFTNTDALLESAGNRITKGHVVVEYGKPIYLDSLSKEEKKFLGSYVQGIIKNMLDNNKKLIV